MKFDLVQGELEGHSFFGILRRSLALAPGLLWARGTSTSGTTDYRPLLPSSNCSQSAVRFTSLARPLLSGTGGSDGECWPWEWPRDRGEGVHRLDPSPSARDVPQTKIISQVSTEPPGCILSRRTRPYTT
jgi:hypothetical protein